ncbi:MAG: S46 family peptidase, partial [Verrucomicrobia bacterium]|nr:S46 family peptidase [Verrucomicrobiota bacterium]
MDHNNAGLARFKPVVFLALFALATGIELAGADEGMWLFNAPPTKQLQSKYQFTLTPEWLEQVQQSSLRFSSGGSGSFISANGLAITNQHVAGSTLQKLSDADHDYVRKGFYAPTLAEERHATDLVVDQLVSIQDVTDRVNAAVPAGVPADQAFNARRKVIADIEAESLKQTGLHSEVVTLYGGGLYHLYRYKRYTDVRLVFAPEEQAAFFGGDPDNFEFPRYDLDISIFRVYEDGKPVKLEHFLRVSPQGSKDGDLVFVSGNPGFTQRQLTTPELLNERDLRVPAILAQLYRREVNLNVFSSRSAENRRQANGLLRSIENSRKVFDGVVGGLLDPVYFGRLEKANASQQTLLTAQIPETANAFQRIATAEKGLVANWKEYVGWEGLPRIGPFGFDSDLFKIARLAVRSVLEKQKPNGERLEEYQDANQSTLERELFSPAPIYDGFETARLTQSLTDLAERYGPEDPLVEKVLDGKSPHDRAFELVKGTKLKDVSYRHEIYQSSPEQLQAVSDPMIQLVLLIDERSRATRKLYEAGKEQQHQAHQVLARAQFKAEGYDLYPDATFTLRLSFGVVSGYTDNG